MYGEGKGGDVMGPLAVVNGGVILPNTGGNKFLVGFAIVSITIGVAIIASTLVRMAVKKAHKA